MYADSLKRILKRTDERRGCIVGWLTFWNPKNLQKKVDIRPEGHGFVTAQSY